jgi:iron complex outermembrane receptor protein
MLAVAGVSLLAIASPAMAQDTAAKDSEESGFATDEIVVQARRRGESAQDVPLVVQAVTAQDLADMNIREFRDVQSLVPGLSLSSSSNGIGAQAAIRGIAFDVNASGNNGTIEFYQNDAHVSAGMLFQSMFDVQQIEVLRGPQGTLRGRASPSGSITVTTTKPDLSEVGGYVSSQINDIGGWNINGAINVPVLEDKLAFRIAGIVDESNDLRVHSINNDTKPSSQMEGIRLSGRFEPFDGLTLSGNYTNTTRDVTTFDQVESLNIADPDAAASPVTIRAKDRLAVSTVPRTYKQNYELYNWAAEYRAFGQKLNYVGAVNKQRLDSFAPSDLGNAYPDAAPFAQDSGSTTATRGKENFHEIRLSSDERVAGIFDYVVGYFYDKLDSPTHIDQYSLVLLPPAFGGGLAQAIPVGIDRTGVSKEESFFLNINAHIGDSTEISGGVRRISYNSTGSLTLVVTPPPPQVPTTSVIDDQALDLKHTIYSASIKHNFAENLMAYASFGTSWRPGSVTNGVILANAGLDVANADATVLDYLYPDPETSESYEIGVKSDWLDGRLRVNLTAFHQNFKNYAYSSQMVLVAGPNSTGQNNVYTATPALAVGVPAKVDGVEAEIGFQATPQWNLNLVAAYAKSKIKDGTVPCNEGVSPDMTYDEFIAAAGGGLATCQVDFRAGKSAPFNATFQTEYNLPLSDSLDSYVRGLFSYYGKSQNDPANPFDDVKSYGIVNLFAGIRDSEGDWEFGLYGKNVFDVLRVTSRTENPLSVSYREVDFSTNPPGAVPATASGAYRGITINNPQEFGVTFRASFGSR